MNNKMYRPAQIMFMQELWNTQTKEVGTPFPAFSRKSLLNACANLGYGVIPVWISGDASRRIGRGVYMFPEMAHDLSTLLIKRDGRGRPIKNGCILARSCLDPIR